MSTDTNLPDTDGPGDVDIPRIGPASEVDLPEQTCLARIEEYDDAPDECTIYPADATPAELTTTWISATEESYVALDAMR
ncbi:DUF7511 domain-containing protein [Halobellus ordinarius]|uniref:DUF7511 domain-containing protein n=1 Tax=Halobellus ordinarius TaxID=3075120 RepID=UPI0028805C3A|nr:hypothetical protein [Halobellus sp. ZY16]